jgi:hypothetical protein
MLEKAVKRVVRAALWTVRSYIRRLDEEAAAEAVQSHNYDHDDYAYPWFEFNFYETSL